ncbi:MAG: zinc metallopeptidase [Coriobacteriia bacterium]|jgi:Zn-dependent membrane protease YugP|nr:zinc metallopeptidase [Coriobacteriia bacterium]MDR2714329.1 zinc metallopeptidase [Coriobacteriales bacterium]
MDLTYLLVLVVTLALGAGSQFLIKSTYKKWSQVPISTQLTGAEVARNMLDANGLTHVTIQKIPGIEGDLSDHFDPRNNVVSLSESVHDRATVGATAVACHECGHAVQHARGYAPAKLRGSLVPVVNLASNSWMLVLMAGIFMLTQAIPGATQLIWLAIILYGAVILFQVVTLPVEFDATSRGLAYIRSNPAVTAQESGGAKSVLRAAALTYVAAALSSLLYLLYLLTMVRR